MQDHFLSDRCPSPPVGNGVRASDPSSGGADATLYSSGAKGEFEGYASVFGVMDLGHDVVMPGAFKESITRRGIGGIKLLWQHDPGQPLGIWTHVQEDGRGLFVRGALDLQQSKAREILSLLKRGALDGLSIGYRTEIERKDPETGLRRLERIDLWEISLVTFPLLPQARVQSVKAAPAGYCRMKAASHPASWLATSRTSGR